MVAKLIRRRCNGTSWRSSPTDLWRFSARGYCLSSGINAISLEAVRRSKSSVGLSNVVVFMAFVTGVAVWFCFG